MNGKKYQGEAVTALLQRFPDASTHSLSRMVYTENPSLFSNLETARALVRYYRGQCGEGNRRYLKDKSNVKPIPSETFEALPKPLVHFDDWKAFPLGGSLHALILSDTHIPYHSNDSLELALTTGKQRGVDTVVLNGDIADCYAVSFWESDPRKRKWGAELEAVRQFLRVLRTKFPKARIIYKPGNHEERWERYMKVKAPELLGSAEFTLKCLLKLDDLGIEWVDEMRPVTAGKLNIVHGHEWRFGITNPVNPARGFFLRAKTHCIGGHFHQTSQHSEKNLECSVVSTWSTGCLCSLYPDYRPINNWNHGFALVEVDSKGAFDVSNLRIIDGKAY